VQDGEAELVGANEVLFVALNMTLSSCVRASHEQ
jgi:hypothetical protein